MRHTHTNRVITDRPGPAPLGFERNWISFRHSLATIDRRHDHGDTAPICTDCGCETDITPQPHSPRCGTPL